MQPASRRAAPDMAFRDHPLRRQVIGEMHLRRFPDLSPPAQLIQLVRLLDADDRALEAAMLETMPNPTTIGGPRHRAGRWSPDLQVTWERHSEASTVTLTATGADAGQADWSIAPDREALTWVEAMPGAVVRAMRIIIVPNEALAAPAVAAADFSYSHLVTCHVAGGARLWTDFRIHHDGYGRMVVAANDLLPGDIARCLQRLQELGNYRNLALLGLPLAQSAWAALDGIDRTLADAGQALACGNQRDDDLLARLTGLSAELLSIAREIDYRMSATAAYARIVESRIAELAVRPIAGHQSLSDFTERRFKPAIRTCATLTERLALLNRRAEQFTALLRARIETHIENQNGRLLASMDRSVRMQLQLQHLVEGLSAVAISYYLVGLLAYPLKATEKAWPAFSATLWLGLAMPLAAGTVFVLMRGLRHRLIPDDDHGRDMGR